MNKSHLIPISSIILILLLSSNVQASSFALRGIPIIEESTYEAQIPLLINQASSQLINEGKIEVYDDELQIAPIVVYFDFQRKTKVAQDVRILADYKPWIGKSGFQAITTLADDKLADKLDAMLKGVYTLSDKALPVAEPLDSESTRFSPIEASDLNRKVDTENFSFVAYVEGGFKSKNTLKATQLAAGEGGEAVAFFPYVNLVLHRQNVGVSQLKKEVVINYAVEMNGYFELCLPGGCASAELPKNSVLKITVPLVHNTDVTSEAAQEAAYEYGKNFLAEVISDFCVEGLKKLSGRK